MKPICLAIFTLALLPSLAHAEPSKCRLAAQKMFQGVEDTLNLIAGKKAFRMKNFRLLSDANDQLKYGATLAGPTDSLDYEVYLSNFDYARCLPLITEIARN